MRHLRSYTSVADKEHWCDSCCSYIMPGEMYEGEVCVQKPWGIVVIKRHVNPCCEPPEDPEDEVALREKRELEGEVVSRAA